MNIIQFWDERIRRREAIRRMAAIAAGMAVPGSLAGCERRQDETIRGAYPDAEQPALERAPIASENERRLFSWTAALQAEGLSSPEIPLGRAAIRVGELAIGTPYEGFALEEYIRAGGSPARSEPLTLSLTEFDCVSLVEACLAIARVAQSGEPPSWEAFANQMERMRYRGGERRGYSSRLHYFSEWLQDNERRGLVRLIGQELGGVRDERPLRFMSSNPDSYPAMAYPEVREEIARMERNLDGAARWVVPTGRISGIADRLQSGDILGFATGIRGLDVTHAAFAYRDGGGVMRVLHAPLSGGVVEITRSTIPQYVAAIRQSMGILVARPLLG
jgi:hypothetical protein